MVAQNCQMINPQHKDQKREWVGLTDEERHVARALNKTLALQFVESKLKEKNQCLF